MAEQISGATWTLPALQRVFCSKCGNPGEFRSRHRQCLECERSAKREWNRQNPEKLKAYRERRRGHYRKLNVEIARRKKAERHAKLDQLKSVPCSDCRETFPPYVMDFDHRDPSTKTAEISQLVNKSSSPWEVILAEIDKCDVVCVCCHRMRTWDPPTKKDYRRDLVQQLKGTACTDCNQEWHYCQLDFDHVREPKLGCVPHMGSKDAIRAEATKCEVVCANCHRERTQQQGKGASRNDPANIDMVWKRQGAGLRTQVEPSADFVPYRVKKTEPAPRDWHVLAGTRTDAEVARLAGISKSMVCIYRKRMGIPSFSKQGRNGGPKSLSLNSGVSRG